MMRWNLRVPAWVAAAGCVAVVVLLLQGVRSGWVPAAAGNDAWVITPPETARVERRPPTLLVCFLSLSQARDAAVAYWDSHDLAGEQLLAQSTIAAAPVNLTDGWKRAKHGGYTIILPIGDSGTLKAWWYRRDGSCEGEIFRAWEPTSPAGTETPAP